MLPLSHWLTVFFYIIPSPTNTPSLPKQYMCIHPPSPISHHASLALSLSLSLFSLWFTMMMQAAMNNSFSPAAKTAEIMSRYRPIAPKPEVPVNHPMYETPSINQSPYLRSVWTQLQARPTRTRKRGRTSISPITLKRMNRPGNGVPVPLLGLHSTAKKFSLHGFAPPFPTPDQLPVPNFSSINASLNNPASAIVTAPESLVTLSLLHCPPPPPSFPVPFGGGGNHKIIDLNTVADIPDEIERPAVPSPPPSQQLRGSGSGNAIIAPQPVRPVGSSIIVECINEPDDSVNSINGPVMQVAKKSEEVEREVDSETLPAVVSDSNNKVRLANSAYNEMVGQPECSWLDSMVMSSGTGASACKRIGGEVMLKFSDSRVPMNGGGFSCWVVIEWGKNGNKKSINVFCDVMKLVCESKDYVFTWRFHTQK